MVTASSRGVDAGATQQSSNLKHFPSSVLSSFNIEALHPDAFVIRLCDSSMQAVVSAESEQRRSLKNPPKTVLEYLATLEQQGLTGTVTRLREFVALI
jgi:hypothetical protein